MPRNQANSSKGLPVHIRGLYRKTLLIEETIEIVGFVLLFVTIIIQIIFRSRFLPGWITYAPIWTEELSRWLFVYVVFFGASQGIYHREHISLDFVVERLPERARLILAVFVEVLMMIASVLFVWYAIRSLPVLSRQRPLTLPVTNRALYIVVPISFGLMAIRIAALIIEDVKGLIRSSPKGV